MFGLIKSPFSYRLSMEIILHLSVHNIWNTISMDFFLMEIYSSIFIGISLERIANQEKWSWNVEAGSDWSYRLMNIYCLIFRRKFIQSPLEKLRNLIIYQWKYQTILSPRSFLFIILLAALRIGYICYIF